ncbi:unnamed protein product, partial [Meganyctiphanes norvegica]
WTNYSTTGSTSSILLYVAGLFLIPRSECASFWGSDKITDNMICHKTANKNTCGGDSGGPVITGSGNSNGPPYVQIGIVSWGSSTCDAYIPKVFADVAKFRDWIDTTISKSSCPDRSSTCLKLAAQGKCKKAKVFNKCKASCACDNCRDLWSESQCLAEAAKGRCKSKKYKVKMGINCKKTCNKCRGCNDNSSQCPSLAAAGKCRKGKVLKKCQKSCSGCGFPRG